MFINEFKKNICITGGPVSTFPVNQWSIMLRIDVIKEKKRGILVSIEITTIIFVLSARQKLIKKIVYYQHHQ